MKLKPFVFAGAGVAVVLALLVWTACHESRPDWQPMAKDLTTPPDVDRSHIPLGPYTVDFSGLIGGPTGQRRVTFYVVMRPSDVHLQRVGEVGKKLEGASVTSIGIRYMERYVPPAPVPTGGPAVDGLILFPDSVDTQPEFIVPGTRDASGQPIRVHCLLYRAGLKRLARNHSFEGIKQGTCRATFRPGPHLHAWMGGVQPQMFSSMAQFLPGFYQQIAVRIQGEP